MSAGLEKIAITNVSCTNTSHNGQTCLKMVTDIPYATRLPEQLTTPVVPI